MMIISREKGVGAGWLVGGWGLRVDWVEGREGERGEERVRRGWGEMWGKREGKGEREREERVSKL